MYIRKTRIGLLAAMTGLLLTSPSYADKPDIVREMNPFNLPIVGCGDFEEDDFFLVMVRGWERDTFKWWYDEFGTPIRLQLKIQVTESEYYNDSNPDNTISQGKNGVGENATLDIDIIDYDNWITEEHHSGAAFRLTIPGIGHVLLDVGTWFFDAEGNLVRHGPDSALAEGETGPALCEALE